MKYNHCVLKLLFDYQLNQSVKAKDLRGAIASLYPEEQLLHQHRNDGKVVYYHPLVQYKVINNECLITGFKEGADLLVNIDLVCKRIFFGGRIYTILNKEIDLYNIFIGNTEAQQQYSFLTPWLALNEKNYEKYQCLGTWQKKKELLEKVILPGNLISMSKSLGYTVPEPIKANIGNIREVPTKLKGTPMLGFLGTFSVNFEIPDYWGIGKSVSRGFGTVKRQRTDGQRSESR